MQTLPDLNLPSQLSKKQQIYNALRASIQNRSLPLGTRLPSTAQLAQEWRVAHATAHAALTELTRDGWLVRTPKQGTFVSCPQPSDQTTATLFLPPREDIIASNNGEAVFDMFQGLTEGAREAGWLLHTESIPSSPSEDDFRSAFKANAQAAIFISTQYRPLIQQFAGSKAQVIVLGDESPLGTNITYDRRSATESVVDHLLQRGRRKIGYIGRDNETGANNKLLPFLEILSDRGAPVRQQWLLHPGRDQAVGAEIRKFLESKPGCDALFVPNYRLALILAREARLQGLRIPEDLAIVALGIEGANTDELPLTYLRVPFLEFGLEAMRQLSASADANTSPATREGNKVLIKPELIIRAST